MIPIPRTERHWRVLRAAIATIWLVTLVAAPAGAEESGRIAGSVADSEGNPVAGASVVLVNAETGFPFEAETGLPFPEAIGKGNDNRFDLRRGRTDAEGRFTIDDVPDGRYRLVAQSWTDADGPIDEFLGVNGKSVELHGIAGGIRVPSEAAERVEIRPLGTGALSIDQNIANSDTLLVVSLASTAADPILGFAGWNGDFLRGMIGGNRMPDGETTLRGLPEGTVHLAFFANDSIPGFAASTVEIRPGFVQRLTEPFVAGWRDGRHQPPERLAPLVEEIRALGHPPVAFGKILEEAGLNGVRHPFEMWGKLAPLLDRPVEMPDGRTVPLGDVAAAEGYRRLGDLDRERARNSKVKKLAEMGIAEGGTYAEAMRDLYVTLGSRYPFRCFELKEIDWEAVGKQFLPAVEFVENDEQFGLLCMELVARLEDSHARLLEGVIQPPLPPLPRFDPGLACLEDDRGRPVVYHVDRGGPAEQAGVRRGMTVTRVDDLDAVEAIAETMAQVRRYYGYSSERYLRYDAFRWFVRRMERGAIVRLDLEAPDGSKVSISAPASLEVRYIPRLPVPRKGISDANDVSYRMLDDRIGYVYVRRICKDLIERLDEAVAALGAAKGLIVDVRGNSGGGFDSDKAHLNFALDRDDVEPDRPRFRGPIALLLDARCISAGEGWASWFFANDRARTFGQTTAGASARKTVHTMANGLYKVRFPTKPYRGFLDRIIERQGLEPDVPILPKAADIAEGRDTVVEAARAWLTGEIR